MRENALSIPLLQTLQLPGNIHTIHSLAIAYSDLESIDLGSPKHILDCAVFNCPRLQSVRLYLENLAWVSDIWLQGCASVDKIVFIDNAQIEHTIVHDFLAPEITHLEIEPWMIYVSQWGRKLSNIESVFIHEGPKIIGCRCFSKAQLRCVKIPDSVKEI